MGDARERKKQRRRENLGWLDMVRHIESSIHFLSPVPFQGWSTRGRRGKENALPVKQQVWLESRTFGPQPNTSKRWALQCVLSLELCLGSQSVTVWKIAHDHLTMILNCL